MIAVVELFCRFKYHVNCRIVHLFFPFVTSTILLSQVFTTLSPFNKQKMPHFFKFYSLHQLEYHFFF